MKRIKFTLICTAALMLTMPLVGCMGGGDSGNAAKNGVKPVSPIERIENSANGEQNDECPDGKCPNSDCNDGKCPEKNDGGDECPDDKCPARPLPPQGRHGRIKPLPCPHN